jgi:aryl-alcohol dehydrogenase-like predicted oxidoreductase
LKEGLDGAQLKAATPKWQRILAVRSLSKCANRSSLDMALQFCRGTPGVTVTLLGMRTEAHLRDNQRYFEAGRLSAQEYMGISHIKEAESKLTELPN